MRTLGIINLPLRFVRPTISKKQFPFSKSKLDFHSSNFERVRMSSNEGSLSKGLRFRVSYNILGQCYVKSSYFPHSPKPCLRFKARSEAVWSTLKNLESDFLCIQELDEYDSFYKENVESLGYSSIYIQRSGKKHDGCGIFYKCNSAELVLEDTVDYNDLVESVQNKAVSTWILNGLMLLQTNSVAHPLLFYVVTSTLHLEIRYTNTLSQGVLL
ncbi:hypothetical protein MKX01_037971 [Papaver californicum]|nr:hypothetical protein MKX01_037971 [Papaver californicum]